MADGGGRVTYACQTCGRTHRSEAAVARCASKEERKANREAQKSKERLRRIKNGEEEPPSIHVRRLRREGKNLDQIRSSLHKNYLPPQFETEWDLIQVAFLVAEGLRWGSVPLETRAMMLLEKHMLSDYVTVHPLRLVNLDIEGVTSIVSLTGDDYRLESHGYESTDDEETSGEA